MSTIKGLDTSMFYRHKQAHGASVRQDPQFAAAHGSHTPAGRSKMAAIKRALIEAERAEKKAELLAELEVGQRRKGVVKRVAYFGAIVDLGGIDGLLHISDMSWGWTNHPSDRVAIDQEIEVQILRIDYEKEWIGLGLKQTQENLWDRVADRYSPGTVVKGTVHHLTNYGAFIEIEEGIHGLLHVANMSWTRMISHPSEMVKIGQVVECCVLSVDQERHQMTLRLVDTPTPAAPVGDGNPASQPVETASGSATTTDSSGPV